jgi:ATP synthase protein I
VVLYCLKTTNNPVNSLKFSALTVYFQRFLQGIELVKAIGSKTMTTDLALPGKRLAAKGIFSQLIVACILVAATAFYDLKLSLSTILGVIAFLVPHTVFSYWVFRYAGATKNQIVARSMKQGMKLKLLLTFFIFVIAFSQLNAQPLLLLGAYTITMVTQWGAMFVFSRP